MPVTTIRLSEETLRRLDRLAKREGLDRTALMRRAIEKGLKDMILDQGVDRYQRGQCSAARAAQDVGLSLWEFLDILQLRRIPFRTDEEHLETLLGEL